MFVECLFENVMQSISISWKIAEFGVIIEDKTAFADHSNFPNFWKKPMKEMKIKRKEYFEYFFGLVRSLEFIFIQSHFRLKNRQFDR